ncbi:hypothetical protein P3X46_015845 [Hevea brasiliensis]|uniref:F-box domain-containing protein n=1 Tax=Hevea brasiliensis TaxID=3981 RepID=A0ABQ9M0I7_HEVBR|nr:F-box protein CPR1-like [Hevea brasiliensis]KAJ9172630.1 hypothetical protein P3X46_015845 [Hevea brasiliensis]
MSDRIPPELVTEILLRSHVHTLQNCRLVSKQWRSIVDDPDFIKRHIDHSIKTNTNNIFFLQEEDGNLYELDFDTFGPGGPLKFHDRPEFPGNRSVSLVGSCNGLLCTRNENNGDILIINPSMRKHRWMPGFLPVNFQTQVHLDDDDIWIHGTGYGFGYDRVSGDYKIVRILQMLGPDNVGYLESEMVICHVKTRVITSVKMPYLIRSVHKMGVFAGGALHWIMGRYDDLRSRNLIVGYDLGTDEFRELPQPEHVNETFRMHIGLLGTCLCMLAYHSEVGTYVWMMKEYGVRQSWTKLFSIPDNLLHYKSIRPLGFSKKGSEILLELNGKRLVWYDLEKKSVELVRFRGLRNKYFETILCLRSLVRTDANGGMHETLKSSNIQKGKEWVKSNNNQKR